MTPRCFSPFGFYCTDRIWVDSESCWEKNCWRPLGTQSSPSSSATALLTFFFGMTAQITGDCWDGEGNWKRKNTLAGNGCTRRFFKFFSSPWYQLQHQILLGFMQKGVSLRNSSHGVLYCGWPNFPEEVKILLLLPMRMGCGRKLERQGKTSCWMTWFWALLRVPGCWSGGVWPSPSIPCVLCRW